MPKTLESPGAFLALMLEKYKLNPSRLAQDIHLSQSAVRLITIGKTKITVPVAMRLAQYFNTNPEFWLAMQMKWDIAEAAKDKELMKLVKSISQVKKGTTGGTEKAAAGKKAAAVKKPVAGKRAAASTKSAAVKKAPVTAKSKSPAAQEKPVVKRGRPAGKK